MLQTIERLRLSDMVADRIRGYIQENDLQPGDRLPTEYQFAARLGVSRLAVREATKALGFLGIVDASPRRGLTVGALDLGRVTPFLQFHPLLRETTPAQLIETRIILETGGLPQVVERMREDASIYEGLAAAAEAFGAAKDVATWIELDLAFHRRLLEASGLAPLVAFHELLEIFFRRFRESVKRAEWKQGMESHRRLVQLLREGQVEAARTELRQHIESHRQRLESLA
ncbi:MAG: FadR family transcriptional regulator [Pirellulales bacterium]|nr:FadR family transcriptional regulator [Pirellulales bacterium]